MNAEPLFREYQLGRCQIISLLRTLRGSDLTLDEQRELGIDTA